MIPMVVNGVQIALDVPMPAARFRAELGLRRAGNRPQNERRLKMDNP